MKLAEITIRWQYTGWMTFHLAAAGNDLMHSDGEGGILDAHLTLAQYLHCWLDLYGEEYLEASTLSQYRGMVRNHISDRLGRIRLGDLTAAHILQLLREKSEVGYSRSTVGRIHIILRRALGHAVRWGILDQNPAEVLPVNRTGSGPETTHLEPEAIGRYLEVAREYRHYAIIFTALHTGMRQGELLALRHRDFAEDRIIVRRALKRTVDGTSYIGPPKSASSYRTIPISDRNRRVINEWLALQREELGAVARAEEMERILFTTATGKIVNPRNLLRTHYRVLDRTGLGRIPFHALRHTHATMLLKSGVHPKVVAERLGHSSIRVTLDTYSHVLPSLQWELVERLDEMIHPERGKRSSHSGREGSDKMEEMDEEA